MSTRIYRETLKETVGKLVQIRGEVFDLLFNVAVSGELKEWADDVPVGESFEFTKEIFEGCDDINMKVLVDLLNQIEGSIHSLSNLNDIILPGENEIE